MSIITSLRQNIATVMMMMMMKIPIVVTLVGILTAVSAVQYWKA